MELLLVAVIDVVAGKVLTVLLEVLIVLEFEQLFEMTKMIRVLLDAHSVDGLVTRDLMGGKSTKFFIFKWV